MKKKSKWIGLLAIGIFLYCCSPAVLKKPAQKEVAIEPQKQNDSNLDPLSKGHDLYTGNCGRCHTLYKPQDFTAEKWTNIMPSMARKSRLDKEQEELVLRYVLSARESK